MATTNRQKLPVQVDRPFDGKPVLPDGLPEVRRPMGEDSARVAGAFGQLAEETGKWADQAARAEGKKQGTIAGNDPTWRPSGIPTIRGAASDEAGVTSYMNQLDAKMRSGISDLFQKHQNDPAALKSSLDEFKAGLFKNDVFPEIAGSIESSFERARLPLQTRAQENMLGLQRDQARATALEAGNASATQRDLTIRADPSSEATRKAVEDSLAADEARDQASVRNETITAEEAARRKIKRRREAEFSLVQGQAEKLKTPDEIRTFREKIKTEYEGGKLPGKMDGDTFAAVEADLEKRELQLRTRGRQEAGTIAREMEAIAKQTASGLPPDQKQVQAIRDRAASMPDGAEQVRRFDERLRITQQAKVRTPAQMEDAATAIVLEASKAERGLTPEEADRVKYLRDAADAKRKAVNRDPLTYATRQGLVVAPPLAVGGDDPADSLARQMPARVEAARAAANALGSGDVRFLTEDDKLTLAGEVKAGGARALAVAKGIVAGAGADAPRILREIGYGNRELLVAGDILRADGPGAERNAREIAGAMELKRNKDIKLPTPPKNATELRRDVLGEALPEEALASIEATAKTIYQARRYGREEPSTKEMEKAYRGALRTAAGASEVDGKTYGGVASYKPGAWYTMQSYKVPVPAGVEQGRFKDVVGALKDEDLAGATDKDGKPIKANAVRGAIPVKVKGGYMFSLDDPSNPSPTLLGKPGAPLIVDMDKLEPELRRRVPGAYHGGSSPKAETKAEPSS